MRTIDLSGKFVAFGYEKFPRETPFNGVVLESATATVECDGCKYQMIESPDAWMNMDTGEVVRLAGDCFLASES